MRFLRAALLTLAILAAGCTSDSGDPEQSSESSSEDASSGETTRADDSLGAPVVPGAPLNPFDLRAGQCFNEGSWYDEELERRIDLTAMVNCDQPHQREVFHEAEFPAPNGAPFPGETKMTEWSTQVCYAAFADFVAAEYELSVYEIDFLQPTQETFEHPVGRHRRVTCFLYDPSTEMRTGSAEATGV